MSAQTVRHASTYIILYLLWSKIVILCILNNALTNMMQAPRQWVKTILEQYFPKIRDVTSKQLLGLG